MGSFMTFLPVQKTIAIYIKEALEQSDHIEWHKGLCGHVYQYVSSKGIVQGLSADFVRYVEIFYDAVYSWKDYSGNPCYPIWLKTHKGSAATQFDLVFAKEASQALQVNYEAKRRQLAEHIVVTLTEKYNV